jgi:hypothetical protein
MLNIQFDTNFSDQTRLWIYPCNRTLNEAEITFIEQECNRFCVDWTAHNHALKAKANIYEARWLVLSVDESLTGASGCSIDKSVHFIEKMGANLKIDFFDRMQFGWLDEAENVCFSDLKGLKEAISNENITPNTLMLNSLVATKKDLSEKWLVPFAKSWHRRLV